MTGRSPPDKYPHHTPGTRRAALPSLWIRYPALFLLSVLFQLPLTVSRDLPATESFLDAVILGRPTRLHRIPGSATLPDVGISGSLA